jgi:nicotinamidase-related amidase
MKVLVVIDMQKDFIDGALGSPEAQAIVPNVVAKIEECAADSGYVIFYTRDTHYEDYMSTSEGRQLPVPHCILGTDGWEINADVMAASEGATFVDVQNKFTFGMQDIAILLETIPDICDVENREVESIEMIGVCTDICVVSNALILKAVYPEIPITVYGDCCAGTSVDAHEAALKVMQMCQIEVI